MGIEQVLKEYNMRRYLRDSLPTCKEEMAYLEQNEIVRKYLELRNRYELYANLEHKSDDTILDEIIFEDSGTLTEDTYFCYGKEFIGHPKKMGGYYIDPNQATAFRLQGTRVTRYRSISKPNEEIIIPSVEAREFEEDHRTIFHHTDNPEQEYYDIRRNLYHQEMRKQYLIQTPDEPTYFCLGKNYPGTIDSDGNYLIGPKDMPYPYIILSYYKNIDNPEDIVIIPTDKSIEFEAGKNILYYQAIDPEQEYILLREKRQKEEPVKRLVKEPKND